MNRNMERKIEDFADRVTSVFQEKKESIKVIGITALAVGGFALTIYNKGRKDSIASLETKLAKENPEVLVGILKTLR